MPTNLDILAGNDFERNPFLQSITRRIHGDHTNTETISAVVEIDNAAAGTSISEGGLDERPDRVQTHQSCLIELAASQQVFSDDEFEIGSDLWKLVGLPVGSDPGSQTVTCKKVRRSRGRMPNVNTQV